MLLTLSISVTQYDTTKGQLALEHAYPRSAHPIPRVSVDVNLILESAPPTAFQLGTWINVIAYTRQPQLRSRTDKNNIALTGNDAVSLRAILIWDAGAIRLRDYENALEEQNLVQRQTFHS